MNCKPELTTGKNLGCFGHCGQIKLPINAKISGTHHIEYKFKGNIQLIKLEGFKGMPICFENKFNECDKAFFKIIQPDKRYYGDGQEFNITIRPSFE